MNKKSRTEHDSPGPSWTEAQFKAAMRKAGWRLNGQIGTYTHKETGKIYHPFNWLAETGENWRQWAAIRQTPPPQTGIEVNNHE